MVFIDLHSHSLMSDGTDTVLELFQRARALDLAAVALTDHDTIAHWSLALEASEATGVYFVPGTEISTRENGTSRHLLAYGFDPRHEALATVLEKASNGRSIRATEMFARFKEIGINLDEDAIWSEIQPGRAPGRAHFGSALVREGHAVTIQDAFDRYVGPGKPVDVKRYNPTLTEAIALVKEAGGVTVLAHSMGRQRSLTFDHLAELVEKGLSGLEVDHQEHGGATRDMLRAWANELEIPFTGGSDYHGTRKENHELGVNVTTVGNYEKLFANVAAVAK